MTIRRLETNPITPDPCFELVTDSGTSPSVSLRVELENRVVSFSREDLRRWTLVYGEPQQLLINIGHDLVVAITGQGLAPLHEALDRDKLATVRCSRRRTESAPWIKSIELRERPAIPPKTGTRSDNQRD